MVTDEKLSKAPSESLEFWAPVHAWRTLGQLKAEESIETLLGVMEEDDDWARAEIPIVLSMIGERSIPALRDFISNPSKDSFARSNAAEALEKIAEKFPHCFEECVSIIGEQFNRYQENSREFNALLIWSLQNLEAAHRYLESIEKAYEAELVDEAVSGDWEDVQIELGLLEERITPKRHYQFEKYPELKSLFERIEGPSLLPPSSPSRQLKKIGRNEPCPCGSGKKYKKCCLKKDQ